MCYFSRDGFHYKRAAKIQEAFGPFPSLNSVTLPFQSGNVINFKVGSLLLQKIIAVGLKLQVGGEDLGVAATVPSLRQDQAWYQMSHSLMLQNRFHCRLCTKVG